MKIEVFAQLKEHFDKTFHVPSGIRNIQSLKEHLAAGRPELISVLESCRFAVDDEFIDNNHQLNENDSISIIPPSSGG